MFQGPNRSRVLHLVEQDQPPLCTSRWEAESHCKVKILRTSIMPATEIMKQIKVVSTRGVDSSSCSLDTGTPLTQMFLFFIFLCVVEYT